MGVYAGTRTSTALASARTSASAAPHSAASVVGVASAANLVAVHPGTLVAGSPAATPEFPVYVTDVCGFKVMSVFEERVVANTLASTFLFGDGEARDFGLRAP